MVDVVAAVVLAACTFVVHDVPYLLRAPFWLDESWVAVSTRAPLGKLPWLTSATPLGWTLLLRLVPGSGQQDLRLLPLTFCALAVVAAYALGREVATDRRGPGTRGHRLAPVAGGLLAGTTVLLVPAMLVRDDLKQYTAEAFVAILLMALVARAESTPSRRRLASVAAVGAAGLLVANADLFVAVAAMAGLGLHALVRRDGKRVLEVAVASAAMLAALLVIYELVSSRNEIPGLVSYWNGYYVPTHHGLSGALDYIHLRMHELAPYIGFHHLSIDAALAIAGCGVLCAMRRFALAAMLPVTFVLLVVASADRKYPFGDERTSTFLTAMIAAYMAIGAVGAVRQVVRLHRPLGVAALAGCLAVWTCTAHPSIRSHALPVEDVRAQIDYVNQHRGPGDVVIVDYLASFGFAYYEPTLPVTYRHISYATTGFLPEFPAVPWVVQLQNREPSDVAGALAAAEAKLAAEHGGGRIWIIRTHLSGSEAAAWDHDLTQRDVTVLPVGSEPLLRYTP